MRLASLAVPLTLMLGLTFTSGAQLPQKAALAPATDPKMKQFVDGLMAKMTMAEKIGQLNLVSVGFDVTGPVVSKDVDANIRKGLVGGVFNTFTPVAVRKLQDLALKESRLHIPLMFGYDVIHGHRTIFPVPLGLASELGPEGAIERSARIAAEEASRRRASTGCFRRWWTLPAMRAGAALWKAPAKTPTSARAWPEAMVRGYQGPTNDLTKRQHRDGLPQALRPLRRGRGGARIQHHRHEPASACTTSTCRPTEPPWTRGWAPS